MYSEAVHVTSGRLSCHRAYPLTSPCGTDAELACVINKSQAAQSGSSALFAPPSEAVLFCKNVVTRHAGCTVAPPVRERPRRGRSDY